MISTTCLAVVVTAGGYRELLAQEAQPSQRATAPEAAAIARAWTLLAQGDTSGASTIATDLLSKYPRSAAVVVLAIDVDVARGGALAGLDTYERWLGRRTLEDGYALRRIAHALLRSTAATDPDPGRRTEAVEALLAEGDADAAGLLASAAGETPRGPDGRAAAANDPTVEALIAEVNQPAGNKRFAIMALAKSRTPRAVEPLRAALTDLDPTVRAVAAEALGAMGRTEAVPELRQLLQDPVFTVRFSAANALVGLKDSSGIPLLRELLASEHAPIRVAAARATKSDAGPEWLTVVRALTGDQDPSVRRQAAELVAPHDPELARATLESLLNHSNAAERQAAAVAYVKSVTTDFAVLRKYLRGADSATRVRAADRILELTR